METSAHSSIAKVKVEYHDPSGVFNLIADEFESRLPLHNLNWKSPSRPLRSIESLHVDLLRFGDSSAPVVKERRHQIPGLRQTPYLKILLLRCDDAETYKTSSRKAIKDWLKVHTPPAQTSKRANSQENHDAFEWLILHVVLPGTRAALEKSAATARPGSAGSDRSKILKGGSLLDKLRTDFASKNAIDRMAQLKLSGLGSELTPDQLDEWDETIAKIKALILASFDLRVGQYETDIQEREGQRSLPGWNFCTFFILKEGLARGFESVGLIDDALAGYEELSVELDSLQIDDDGPISSLPTHTKDLQDLYSRMQDHSISADQNFWGPDNPPLSTSKRNYRELILANDVSIFEFKCYILARKMAILLRMSRATKAGTEDLVPLGHLCQLAVLSIPSISRIMQADLRTISSDDLRGISIVDNIVASWVYTATQQVLADTSSAFLAVSSPNEPHFSSLLKGSQSAYPTRKSSLNAPVRKPKDDAQTLFDQLKTRSAQNRSGKDYLALQRAQLLLLQRRQVETIASRVRFTVGWAKTEQPGVFVAFQDVQLNDEDSEEESVPEHHDDTTLGICNFALYDASKSRKALRTSYETLTREALDLFFTAGQSKSFERMLADLAIARYQSGDFAGAANYFSKVIPVYSQSHWTLLQTEMLLVHAKCLKILNRRDDYVRMLLGLLALIVSSKGKSTQIHDLEGYTIHGQTILNELNIIATQLPYDIHVNLSTYFQDIRLDPHIRHNENVSGFQMYLKLRSIFEDHMVFEKITVSLASLIDNSVTDIQLQNQAPVRIPKGLTTISVSTNTITNGSFVLKSIVMQSGRIVYTYDATQSMPKILVYPRLGDVAASLSMSRTVHIDQPRKLELMIVGGSVRHDNVTVTLKPASAGLRLHTTNASLLSESSTTLTATAAQILLSSLPSQQSISIAIPYELEDAHGRVFLGVEIKTEDASLDYRSTQSASVELPLDVNVHDSFKENHIFQRFHLKSSSELPLQILDVSLADSNDFHVEQPDVELFPTIVFPKHPATFMYCIKQASTTRLPPDQEDPLILTVDYQCYDELVIETITQKLTQDLQSEEYAGKSLIVSTLRERLQQSITNSQITTAALTRNIQCPAFDAIGWASLIRELPSATGIQLETFLQSWHSDNKSIPLPDSDNLLVRKLIISVPLPYLDILQTAHLKLPELSYATIGTPFSAVVTLSHITRWAPPQSTAVTEFMYDVDAPIGTWLIGGQRRGRFSAQPDEILEWQIILMPLKSGKLLLPSIDVRAVGKHADDITCETEYKGFSQTVTVLDALRRTTVALNGTEARLITAET